MFYPSTDANFEEWIDRIDALLDHQECLSSFDFEDKFDFEEAFEQDRSPREVVAILVKRFLDN